MDALTDLVSSNAALFVSVVALLISLRANFTAHKAHELNVRNKADADRVLLAEKKREVLNELDRQHATLATLSFVTAQEVLVFQDCLKLNELLPDELDRLRSNLKALEELEHGYEPQRKAVQAIDSATQIHSLDERLAGVRRLSIHLEKDIAHEKTLLEQLRHLARTAPAEGAARAGASESTTTPLPPEPESTG
jgi:hypothetical protein